MFIKNKNCLKLIVFYIGFFSGSVYSSYQVDTLHKRSSNFAIINSVAQVSKYFDKKHEESIRRQRSSNFAIINPVAQMLKYFDKKGEESARCQTEQSELNTHANLCAVPLSKIQALSALDLKFNATQSDIRRAYYQKALVLHPDRGGSTDHFIDIHEAYETLMDAPAKQNKPLLLEFSNQKEKEEDDFWRYLSGRNSPRPDSFYSFRDNTTIRFAGDEISFNSHTGEYKRVLFSLF